MASQYPKLQKILTSLVLSIAVLNPVMLPVLVSVQAQPAPNRKTEADQLIELGRQQYWDSHYEAAKQFWEKALTGYRTIHNRDGEAWTLNYLGLAYFALSQYDKAITAYEQALPIFRELKQRNGEAQTLKDLGQAYSLKSEYAKAISLYQQALPLLRAVKDRNQEAWTLQNLGNTYRSLAQYDKAVTLYLQALSIFRTLKNLDGQAYALKNLGFTHFSQSQYDKAVTLYQQALPLFQKVRDLNGQAYSLVEIGLSYSSLSQYSKAVPLYTQALSIFRQIGDRKGEAHALMNWGNIYRLQSQYNQASNLYQQALPIFQEVKDLEGEGFVLNNIGQLLKEKNEPELAIIFYKQSVEVRETIRKNNSSLPRNLQESYIQSVSDTYRRLADLLLQQDRVLEAQQVLDLLKVQELDDYLRNVRGTGQKIEFLKPEQEILERYTGLQKTAIQVGSRIAELAKLDSKNALTPPQQKELADLRELERKINAKFNDFISSTEIKQLVEKLARGTSNQNVRLEEFNQIKTKLDRLNAVLLYPLILDNRLELVLIAPGTPPLRRTVANISREELNRTVLEFRTALGNHDSKVQVPAQKLYHWLIEPLEADLKQINPKTILYAPDGQLRYIPLAALHDGKQWLVQRYRINNITALAVSDLTTPPKKDPSVLAAAFGGEKVTVPVENQSFEFLGLPFAKLEVELLVKDLPNTVPLLDKQFSRATMLARMNSFTIVHLATHGKFLIGNPQKSFIVMGDGSRLSLNEIQDNSLDNIDLVVLSACETGVGLTGKNEDGVEVLGIGYQFQRGGAKAAIATLWQVSDGGTQKLMDIFYGLLKQGNVTKAEALQQAQIALITGDFTAGGKLRGNFRIETSSNQASISTSLKHPFYWAPFILIGNGL